LFIFGMKRRINKREAGLSSNIFVSHNVLEYIAEVLLATSFLFQIEIVLKSLLQHVTARVGRSGCV